MESVERFGESKGKLLAEIFSAVAERRLLQPTYVIDYPAEISPLSKTKPGDPSTADRFELFIGRMEVANGFCELNDPDEQAEKFRAQVAERTKGDDEAMLYDEDYVEALSYGMPPTAGEGVGIDRLAMLFTDSRSIRDVILFPLMRPKKDGEREKEREERKRKIKMLRKVFRPVAANRASVARAWARAFPSSPSKKIFLFSFS